MSHLINKLTKEIELNNCMIEDFILNHPIKRQLCKAKRLCSNIFCKKSLPKGTTVKIFSFLVITAIGTKYKSTHFCDDCSEIIFNFLLKAYDGKMESLQKKKRANIKLYNSKAKGI